MFFIVSNIVHWNLEISETFTRYFKWFIMAMVKYSVLFAKSRITSNEIEPITSSFMEWLNLFVNFKVTPCINLLFLPDGERFHTKKKPICNLTFIRFLRQKLYFEVCLH